MRSQTKGLNGLTTLSTPVSQALWDALLSQAQAPSDELLTDYLWGRDPDRDLLRELCKVYTNTPRLKEALYRYFAKFVPGYPVDCTPTVGLTEKMLTEHPRIASDTYYVILSFCSVNSPEEASAL